jgi:hypothetical protein
MLPQLLKWKHTNVKLKGVKCRRSQSNQQAPQPQAVLLLHILLHRRAIDLKMSSSPWLDKQMVD